MGRVTQNNPLCPFILRTLGSFSRDAAQVLAMTGVLTYRLKYKRCINSNTLSTMQHIISYNAGIRYQTWTHRPYIFQCQKSEQVRVDLSTKSSGGKIKCSFSQSFSNRISWNYTHLLLWTLPLHWPKGCEKNQVFLCKHTTPPPPPLNFCFCETDDREFVHGGLYSITARLWALFIIIINIT